MSQEQQSAPSFSSAVHNAPTRVAPDPDATRRAQRLVIALAVALMGGSVGMRLISGMGLQQSAVLFIGLPAVLAIAVARTKPAQTVTGLIFKTAMIVLLLASILFGETLICILIASPLVFLICTLVGAPIDAHRRMRAQGRRTTKYPAMIGLVLLASLEGAVPGFEMPREASVTVTRHVHASPGEVAAALARRPDFSRERPRLLQIGFPRPTGAWGSGLSVGDRRYVEITGDGHYGTTSVGHLVMEVTRRTPNAVRFATVSDTTRVAEWLGWKTSDVSWTPSAVGGTDVTWTVQYERKLAPFWYFDPIQRAAVSATGGYLIDSLATP